MMSFIRNLFTKTDSFDTRWPLLGQKVGDDVILPPINHTSLSNNQIAFPTSKIESVLAELNLPCSVTCSNAGPVTTTYDLKPLHGTRIGLLPSRAVDIAIRLEVESVDIQVGRLTVPNIKRTLVNFTDCTAQLYCEAAIHNVPYIIGVDENGNIRIGDLTTSPHTLIAGSTGSGKSVFVNNIMASIMAVRHPTHVRFVMIDPKRVEYAQYQGLPHLLHPVIDEIPWAVRILEGLCDEMDRRYQFLSQNKFQSVELWNAAKCPNLITVTPQQLRERIYPIIVFIDEYADLVMQDKKAALFVTRLAQKARAAGIHIVLCTQHPKANIISTNITSNFPTQIAFQVRTRSASGVILDRGGAQNLLRKGDMIFQNADETFRAQGPFVSQQMTDQLVSHWRH